MAKGGRPVYWGPSKDAIPTIRSALGESIASKVKLEDADDLLDVVQEHANRLARHWAAQHCDDAEKPPVPIGSQEVRTTPYLPFQFVVQLIRCTLAKWTELGSILISILAFAFCGCLLGLAFFETKYVLPSPSVITEQCPPAVSQLTDSSLWNRPCADDWPATEKQGFLAQYLPMLVGTLAASTGVLSFDSMSILPVMRRETECGTSLLAFLFATDLVDSILVGIYSFAFTSFYFLIASPFGYLSF